jgi:GTPase SAR1 family protein
MEISNESEILGKSFLNITEFQKIFGHDPGRDKYMIKIALLGYPGTGKSSFIKRFCDQVFPTVHTPSINTEITSEVIRVDESLIIEVFLYEIAGQTQYLDIKDLFVHGVQGIILMYAPHYEYSFRRLDYLITFLEKNLMNSVPKLLVSNCFEGIEKKVTHQQAAELCKKFDCDFMSVDVKRLPKSVDDCIGYFVNKLIEGVGF